MSLDRDDRLFNVDILPLTKDNTKLLREVKTPVIFETGSNNFHPDGLFSKDIFGPIGSNTRNIQFGYIDLMLPILHPFVYKTLTRLGAKYLDIAEGKKYAVYDKEEKDLVLTTEGGSTGYKFLLDTLPKIEFNDNGSDDRRYRIDYVTKYANPKYMSTRWLVIPAGLRDYTVDDAGKPSEDEINNLYRKLLSVANMLKNTNITDTNIEILNPIRLKIQKCTLEIFEYIYTLIDGKNKFIQGRFAARNTRYGTRNVLTPIPAKIDSLENPNKISLNDTSIGLYQYIKAITPITINRVQSMFINHILNPSSNQAYLFNPDTKLTELVKISVKKRDEWLTVEGLNNTMNKLGQSDLRWEPVTIDNYYLAMVKDTGSSVTLYTNSNEYPQDLDLSKLRPITYAELFYIAIYDIRKKYPAFITRYPVTGQGSIYPSTLYVKTTTTARTINFTFNNVTKEMVEYPVIDTLFVESMSVNINHLKNLGGDFDGDVLSLVVLYTEESIREIDKYLNSKEGYLTQAGDLIDSNADDNIDIVMSVLTQ